MAFAKALKLGVVLAPMAVAAFVFPPRDAAGPPSGAAQRAEGQAPALGLTWGKLRAFSREKGAWRLTYQPWHGAWVVTVRVPDASTPERPSLQAASWLPGARLSAGAARRLAGGQQPLGLAERLARRDWLLADRMVVGSLVVAKPPAPTALGPAASWPLSAVVGLLLAGAAARRMRPQPPVPVARRAVAFSCAVLLAAAVGTSRLAGPLFVPGVRPFVSLLLFQALCALLLAWVAAASFVLPTFTTAPRWWPVGAGFAAGWLSGLLVAPAWAVAVAAVPPRPLLMVAAPVVAAYLGDLAAGGGHLLIAPLGRLGPWATVAMAGASFASGGWGMVLGGILLAAVWPPAQRFWFVMALAAGFLPGAWWASVGWWGPLRDGLVLSLAVWAGLALWAQRGEP